MSLHPDVAPRVRRSAAWSTPRLPEAPRSPRDERSWERARRLVVRLVRRAFPRLSHEDVEDAAQDTLAAFWENTRHGHPVANPEGLLASIGRHKASDAHRRRRRSPFVPLDGDDADRVQDPVAPHPHVGQDLAHAALLVLFDWTRTHCERDLPMLELLAEGKSLAEIGVLLGLNAAAVRKRASRLRESIRRHRQELGLDEILDVLFDEWSRP